jgi:hypothetical protein
MSEKSTYTFMEWLRKVEAERIVNKKAIVSVKIKKSKELQKKLAR